MNPSNIQNAGVLAAIGNTSLVQLTKVVPPNCGNVFVKLEWENPTGSMKDRAAQSMIQQAETDGRLKPGDRVVEYTGGSTGIAIGLICIAKGYRLHIVTSDAFSIDKRNQMEAFGATLQLVPSENGKTTKSLILKMIDLAKSVSEEPDTYWPNQLSNRDSIAGYHSLGHEIWNDMGGNVDAFVHSVGSSASFQGVGTILRQRRSNIDLVAVEPAESAVLSGGQPGPHKIEGIGVGYIPPLWDQHLPSSVVPVETEEAKRMTRRLALEEGLFAGTSSGANVSAAIEWGKRIGPGKNVVTLLPDTGLKYMNTDVFHTNEK